MSELFANIIIGINTLFSNYGITMIVFTLLIKLVVLPLDYKSRKSMRRMSLVQPQVNKLQKKYANDKDKLNQKMAELYKKEGVSPMSGCLPMLVSMVILYIMWAGMRLVANQEIAKQTLTMVANGTVNYPFESFLWIKNIWMPDSPFHPTVALQSDLTAIPLDVWTKALATFSTDQIAVLQAAGVQTAATDATTLTTSLWTALQAVDGYSELLTQKTAVWNILINIEFYTQYNGFFILPVLSAVTQYIQTVTQPQQPGAETQQNSTTNFMKYFFPLFSLWICSSFNAMFALYWVISNVYAWIETIVLNKVFEQQDKTAAAVKQEEESLK